MRYVRAISLVLAALFGVGLITSVRADAVTSAAPPPLVPPPGGMTLTQDREGGTWSTSAYLDTGALCGDTFDLVTGSPDTDNTPTTVTYTDNGAAVTPCVAAAEHPVTDVALTFPALKYGAIPQTATLVVTPSPANIAAGANPVEISLMVRRQLTGASSLWFTVWFGLAFVVAVILLIAGFGVAGPDNRRLRWGGPGFWTAELHAPSKWTFGGSYAANFTALGTAFGGVLAATGAVAGIVPGVDLGRIGLLFAMAGLFALIAPLVFASLNSHFAPRESAGGTDRDIATKTWIMVAAACCTAIGIGAEVGLIGWVLGYHLSVAPVWMHWVVLVATGVVSVLFLAEAVSSICGMHGHRKGHSPEGENPAESLASAAEATSPP